jgi:NADH-quinone oxidoreductase subunit E
VTALVESEVKKTLEDIFSRYTREKGNLIPVLQEAQGAFRYLPPEVMQEIAKFLRIPEGTVYGVSTFYAQFKFTPIGKKIVKVCRGTACHVRGAPRILDDIEKRLCIEPGETTEDLEYSLETIACFGSCALAPVMVVDDEVHGRMTPTKVGQILGETKREDTKG